MRLINTSTLQMHKQIPSGSTTDKHKYAILSHRWLEPDDDEVTFQEMSSSSQPEAKRGYIKVKQFCQHANRAGYEYAWVDTCCIDKTSSSELQEAIISMWNWYHQAEVCFVYLQDARKDEAGTFEKSEWFDRGWTLQELLSPRHVKFYDREWQYIGDRDSLADIISRRTRIPKDVLMDTATNLRKYSIAARMSWAAGRKTTRIEDRAYSLLGLFDVYSIATPYGVQENAMLNLQQALLRLNDESLFVWKSTDPDWHSLFAPSPDAFADSGECIRLPAHRRPAEGTTNGVVLSSDRIIPYTVSTWIIPINCAVEPSRNRIGIFVRLLRRYEYSEDHFIRVQVNGKGYADATLVARLSSGHALEDCSILLCDSASLYGFDLNAVHFAVDLENGFRIGPHLRDIMGPPSSRPYYGPPQFTAGLCVKPDDWRWKFSGLANDFVYAPLHEGHDHRVRGFILGFDSDFNPWCQLLENEHFRRWTPIDDTSQDWDEKTQYEPLCGSPRPMLAYRYWGDTWRIKGSRHGGLDVFLPSRTPRSKSSRRTTGGLSEYDFRRGMQWKLSCIESKSSEPCRVTLTLKPAENGKAIWEFDMQNIYAVQEYAKKHEINELAGVTEEKNVQDWSPNVGEIATLKDLGITLHRSHDTPSWHWLDCFGRNKTSPTSPPNPSMTANSITVVRPGMKAYDKTRTLGD